MKKIFGKIFRLPIDEKSSRGGFTLVEVVVALAVIVIVTGISIGVVSVDNKTHVETVDMIEATNIAENAIECFRFAVKNNSTDVQKRNEFNLLLARSMNPEFAPIYDDVGGGIINIPFELVDNNHYIITEDRVTVYIAVDFVNDEITISAKNAGGTNEYLIEEVTYTVR